MPQEETIHVTPEEIINFLLEEMEAGMSPSYYSNLVPSVYDVYLYIDDLERRAARTAHPRRGRERLEREACETQQNSRSET